MIKEFKTLTTEEKMLLFKAPVMVSVLTFSSLKEISKAQKDDAVKLVHMKTYTEHHLLVPYYEEVEKTFKKDLEEYAALFFPLDTAHCRAIKKDMEQINTIIDKLDSLYGGLLRKSIAGFARHVNNAARNVLQDLVFPVAFSKL